MHVALLANTAWLDEELAQFRYLVVGLLDEQVRVTQVVPQGTAAEEFSSFSDQVRWSDTRFAVLRWMALHRLKGALEQLGVDLVHALDGRLWHGALSLAKRLKVPAVLSASSVLDLAQVSRLHRTASGWRMAYAAATEPLGRAIAEKASEGTIVEVIPPGVHVTDATPAIAHPDHALCAVISGSSVADAEYEILFEAIRAVVADFPLTQFFLDLQSSNQHALYRLVDRYGLLPNLSMVPRRLGHRELLLRADALLHPQPLGRARSLTLQAMASAVPIIARDDPWLDYLVQDQTAWLVQEPDPAEWERLLRRLIAHRVDGRELGLRARQWIAERRLAVYQVEATIALYRQVTGESIKFPKSSQRE